MPNDPQAPTRAELADDLKLLREKGLPEIDDLRLPALLAAAKIVVPGEPDDGAAQETLLRRAAARLGGGSYGDAARALIGLDDDTRTLTAGVRRSIAAQCLGVSLKTLLRRHEEQLLNQTARQILVLCADQRQRDGRDRLAAEHPVESGMAFHWLERFQAYYRLWSPIYGLAADLSAYRATLLEQPRPFDRRFGSDSPDDPGYSQEEQAEGYARFALHHYATFEWELRQFRTLYGGLWMLSEPDIETAVSDAVYQISWHVNPFNERDQSFLRTVIDETPQQELHPFLERLASSDLGRTTHQEWQDWCTTCNCSWPPNSTTETDYFPTSRNQPGVSDECQLHQAIAACGLYCELIDKDWLKIADWYHIDNYARHGVTAERIYVDWRLSPRGAAYRPPT